ncbi:phospholipid carrier-dependent glycosyltransferase [Methanospirillum sp. J.3.6.1-F.2.7.3]|uniref:Phospholipid carrier-dependent glycosyltransferase n=1 Tax=Methanospirillum purgamenti TaxID=2834276 RepID=A0A8E7AXJ2_9EURY|nr:MULTISPECIES: phospholipid carrier-dependent glycosyltransferase [Methanospirillum]MDX8549508.1 phospholipid carrier-dependent glycosyltransferase [Methanospirillum hungatei]QVV89210.1 phospholipid carrier-dependent glycosyltransferase [Methanospirillum sp. J.3.6.1-F.2.7.3]
MVLLFSRLDMLDAKRMSIIRYDNVIRYLLPLTLFLFSLIPRSLDLGTGLIFDEQYWLERSPAFFDAVLAQEWGQTRFSGHPGVTTMWLSGLSIFFFKIPEMGFPEFLTISRLPIVSVTSLGILVSYYLLIKIFDRKTAFLSCILMALDPFFIAHSRFIHLDAMTTTWMMLAVLSFFVYLHQSSKLYIVFTGIFTGLAVLTKLPALFLLMYIPLALLLWSLLNSQRNGESLLNALISKEIWFEITKNASLVILIASIIYFLLFPVMWVNPGTEILKSISGVKSAIYNPHDNGGFFLGKANDGNNGPLFYPIIILMRSTPFTIIFFFTGVIYLFSRLRYKLENRRDIFILLSGIFCLLFTLQMGLSLKAFDRYILPIFPFICIIASYGFWNVITTIWQLLRLSGSQKRMKKLYNYKIIIPSLILVCAIVQLCQIIPIAPYYNSYYNPICGGSHLAQKTLLIGWGEGNDIAAKYLNQKPNAQNLTVGVQYPGFSQYFIGKSVPISQDADYYIFYISMIQRERNLDIWERYKEKDPEKIIRLNGINYVWIYRSNVTDEGKPL